MEQKNLILAIVISVGIMLGFHYFYEAPRVERMKERQAAAQQEAQQTQGEAPKPIQEAEPESIMLARDEALARSPRLPIQSAKLKGSINLKGGKIDDLILSDYKETTKSDSPSIALLSPLLTDKPYYADWGWVSGNQDVIAIPTSDTLWTPSQEALVPNQPLILSWDNGQGLTFQKIVTLDDNYMFKIEQKVLNSTGQPYRFYPYGLISRTGTPQKSDASAIIHEGALGFFEDKYQEFSYEDLRDKRKIEVSSSNGWLGITDKYFLVTLAPEEQQPYKVNLSYYTKTTQDKYQTDFLGGVREVAPGQTISSQSYFFAGPKKLDLLTTYETSLKIERFDLAIDFGWLYFLTKPFFFLLDFLYKNIANFGICILILTVLVRLALFPLANNSFKTFARMRQLTPEINRLKERYAEDKMRMNQELMALYKKEKINPMAGCLPLLLQIPVFFALYKVLSVSIEMRHAPFFGWIHDLSAPDPTSIVNLFGLLPFEPFFNLGAWPLIMGVTMFLQQKLNPPPTDPMQAKMMSFLPIVFTLICAGFPSGLVIYWTWGNILSGLQQWYILRRHGDKAPQKTALMNNPNKPKKAKK